MNKDNSPPLVTLTLFSYNQDKYIQQAVKSALEQDYSPLEIIISDDCSTDTTLELIKKMVAAYKGAHTVRINHMPQNVGFARHLNHVFDMAEGEIIVVAAGDDICFPNKVSALAQPMLENKNVTGVHSGVIEIDTNGQEIRQNDISNPEFLADPCQIIESSLAVASQSHAFRKSVHEFFGPYEPFITNEGKIMAFRESLKGSILYLSKPLTYYRVGSGISTYNGIDIDKLTLDEPRKIASWNYTSILQIEKDSKIEHSNTQPMQDIIKRKKIHYKNIHSINSTRYDLTSLIPLITYPSVFLQGLKALIRTNSPYIVRALYAKKILRK